MVPTLVTSVTNNKSNDGLSKSSVLVMLATDYQKHHQTIKRSDIGDKLSKAPMDYQEIPKVGG
jgi:hypothetical protein